MPYNICKFVNSVAMACIIFAPSVSYAAGSSLNMVCELYSERGPDGQPMSMTWSIDLHNRRACLLPECSVKAHIYRANNSDIWLKFPSTTGGAQLFKINLGTGEFLWRNTHDYSGKCHKGVMTRMTVPENVPSSKTP